MKLTAFPISFIKLFCVSDDPIYKLIGNTCDVLRLISQIVFHIFSQEKNQVDTMRRKKRRTWVRVVRSSGETKRPMQVRDESKSFITGKYLIVTYFINSWHVNVVSDFFLNSCWKSNTKLHLEHAQKNIVKVEGGGEKTNVALCNLTKKRRARNSTAYPHKSWARCTRLSHVTHERVAPSRWDLSHVGVAQL